MDNKLSFTEMVNNFTEKFGADWCNNPIVAETVFNTFFDYALSLPTEQFDFEKAIS